MTASRQAAKNGEWVQEYTRRGSPMRGKFRWRTNSDKQQETAAAIVIAAAMVLATLLPALIGD